MNEKINILENENKEIIILKNENDELIKKFDEMNTNYNALLKDFDALNANNSNLLNNQSIIFNSFKNNNIPINEKSSIPWIRNPLHPSSRSTVFEGASSVLQTNDSSSSVFPTK